MSTGGRYSQRIHLFIGHCTAQCCFALHCTTLPCTALHLTLVNCTGRQSTKLNYTALHCTALHCTAPHCNALHCNAQYYTALHCIALPCTHCTAQLCVYTCVGMQAGPQAVTTSSMGGQQEAPHCSCVFLYTVVVYICTLLSVYCSLHLSTL